MTDNEVEFNCKKCNAGDNDRMVQCDKCDQWYHYDCVAVNSGVANISWNCKGCDCNTEAAGTNATAHSVGNPAIPNSMDLLKQPQATSSPTTTGGTQQLASTITDEISGKEISNFVSNKWM